MSLETFKEHINKGYQSEGDHLLLGASMMDDETVLGDAPVKIPLATLNRHGLIAGATGTGKTKTLQVISEEMSSKGISVLLMDLKGDLSGLAAAGTSNEKIEARHEKLGFAYTPHPFPVELLTLSDEAGVKMRATVTEFGPILFSKILELTDTQSGIISVLFKYCDDNGLPLLDLKDLKKVLNYILNEGKEGFTKDYGTISSTSVGAILRKIVELEQQGAEQFFGEISFDPEDLMSLDENGRGKISILRLTDMQDRPKLFSTFMLSLLAEIYETFPEEGDAEQPKLCIFIDEAHLIFNNASKALLEQITSIVKLIRSKGVGLFFATQDPTDIPDEVLGQLGLKVQHALRAFTAKDRKSIKKTAENYPLSDFYDTAEMLTSLGIGEAAITALDDKGRPTPLARVMLRAPRSRMDVLNKTEINELVSKSKLVEKYNEVIDRESAYEMLEERLKREAEEAANAAQQQKAKKPTKSGGQKMKEPEGFLEEMSKNTMVRQVGRTMMREVTRGLLGALTGRKPRRGRRMF